MSEPVDADPAEPGGSGRLKGLAQTVEHRARTFGRNVDLWQQRHAVIAFPWGVYRKYADDSGGRAAAQLAYYALFSIAPLMLVFAVLLANLLEDRPELRADMVDAIFGAFPEVAAQLDDAIANVPDNSWAAVVGVLGVLYAGLGVTESAQYAFNQIWAVPWRIRPGFFPRQGRALGMTLLLYAGLIGYAFVATWSGVASNHDAAIRALVLALSAAVLFGVILVSYWVLCGRKLTFWQVWPGTLAFLLITAIVIPFLSGIFSRLVEDSNAIYGALGSVIALLTLFYLTAVLFILTAEINSVRAWHLWPRGLFPDWLSHADRKTYAILAPVEERMPEQRVVTYFGVLSDRFSRELGPEFDEDRFEFVDSPPPYLLDDPDTVLMDYYVEGRDPAVVIHPHRPAGAPNTEPPEEPGNR
jgi:YihY family inner membrane protein